MRLKVALLRFDEHYALQQIQDRVKEVIGHEIPLRTLCELSSDGLSRIEDIHRNSSTQIRRIIDKQGGYILHLDGTFEEEPPLLFIAKDGISGITLDAELIPSESEVNLKPILERFEQNYGMPLAVVRDGGDGVRKAIESVFPDVPQVACQYHVLKNVGKALFEGIYAGTARIIERLKIVPAISKLCKRLQLEIDAIPEKDKFCAQILYVKTLPVLEPKKLLPLVTYAVGSWVLRTKSNSEKNSYPFTLPYLDLYMCSEIALPKIHGYVITLAEASRYYEPLAKLECILKKLIKENQELVEKVTTLKWLSGVFYQLRAILRIKQDTNLLKYDPKWNQELVETCKMELTKYLDDLEKNLSSLDKKNIRRKKCAKAIAILREQCENLFVPNPVVNINGKIVTYKLPRTNNILEREFWAVLRCLLKLKGRKRVKQGLHLYGKRIALLRNLKNEKYMDAVYPEGILLKFAKEGYTVKPQITHTFSVKPIKIPASLPVGHIPHFLDRSLAVMQRAFSIPSEPPPPLSMSDIPANGLLPS